MSDAPPREVRQAAVTLHGMTADLRAGRPALWCDLAPELEVVGDGVLVTGWAHSAAGIESVEAVVDGELRFPAKLGVERGDTVAVFGPIDGIERAGFTCGLPETALSPGPHSLEVVARDRAGDAVRTLRSFSYRPYEPGAPEVERPWSGE